MWVWNLEISEGRQLLGIVDEQQAAWFRCLSSQKQYIQRLILKFLKTWTRIINIRKWR
jgi:hypothetical protein